MHNSVSEVKAFCLVTEDYFLEFYVPEDVAVSTVIKLIIDGVTLTSSVTPSINYYLYLSVDGSFQEKVTRYQMMTEIATLNTISNLTIFPITNAFIQPSRIRQKLTHNIFALFPQNSIVLNKFIFVEFLYSDYSRIWKPICKIIRQNDLQQYNWAQSCEFLTPRRLKIIFRATDGNITSSQKTYQLIISNGPSPNYYRPDSSENLLRYRIIFPSTDLTDISYFSVYQNDLAQVEYQTDGTKKDFRWVCKNINGIP